MINHCRKLRTGNQAICSILSSPLSSWSSRDALQARPSEQCMWTSQYQLNLQQLSDQYWKWHLEDLMKESIEHSNNVGRWEFHSSFCSQSKPNFCLRSISEILTGPMLWHMAKDCIETSPDSSKFTTIIIATDIAFTSPCKSLESQMTLEHGQTLGWQLFWLN